MTDLIAPATVTIRPTTGTVQTIQIATAAAITLADAKNTQTINVAAPPVAGIQVVAVGSPIVTTTTDGHKLSITASGAIVRDAATIAGAGWGAYGYDPATNGIYGRDLPGAVWWAWTAANGQWVATTWTPTGVVTPPVVPPVGTRRACDIPFASTSVWNIGIGSGAQWGAPGDPDVAQLRSLAVFQVQAGAWGQPTFFGTASDPLVTVTCAGNYVGPAWSHQIHCPASATPSIGTDAHMNIFDETQPHIAISVFGCTRAANGDIHAQLGGLLDLTADGISGVTGTDNYLAGVISGYDLDQRKIRHAVRFALSPDVTRSPNADYGSSIGVPWPNSHVDYYGPRDYTGIIMAGCTIGIAASVAIAGMGLSPGGLMLAECLQNYAGIWRDMGGPPKNISFYSVPERDSDPLIQGMRADMKKIMSVASVMRNQGPNSVNGGGTSRVPLLPPIA